MPLGGGTNNFPRMEMVVCFASSMVNCFGAQPRNAPDMITIREDNIKKIRIEDRLSTFDGIEWEGLQVFLTSIILHLIWVE
jgi:hypothetical protein